MQRQDDYLITREAMLLFIAQLLSLSAVVFRVVAQCRTIDDRLLHAFVRSELAMQIVLSGIVSNTDTRGTTPGLDDIIEFDEPPDRHAELLRIGASLQQIAMMLALLLAMNPRAFRDRTRTASFWGGRSFSSLPGGHSLSSFRGGVAEPGIQRWHHGGFALGSMTPNARSIRQTPNSGFRIPLRGSGMTSCVGARGPP